MIEIISLLANIAAIMTAIVAVFGYGKYHYDAKVRLKKLEVYLKNEKHSKAGQGQRTVLHLMAKLGLTEAEILQASFHSKNIIRRVAKDPKTNRAEALLFEYAESKANE